MCYEPHLYIYCEKTLWILRMANSSSEQKLHVCYEQSLFLEEVMCAMETGGNCTFTVS